MTKRFFVLMMTGLLVITALGATPLNALSHQNGEPNDEPTSTPSLQNTITVKSTDNERADYQFKIYGNATYGNNADPVKAEFPDKINGQTISGSVAENGTDNYQFSGVIVGSYVDGPAKVYINGERANPGTPEDQTQYMNKLVISGQNTKATTTYQFSVTGELQVKNNSLKYKIENGHGNGSVSTENDTYLYTGKIKNFTYSGTPTVFVKGEKVDPAVLANEKPATTPTATTTLTKTPVRSTTARSVDTPAETNRSASQTDTTGPGFGIVAAVLAIICVVLARFAVDL